VEQGAGSAYPPVLAGRAAELGAVERFLAPGPAGRMLVVYGEPGIGKSTVWEAGVGLARSRGFAVLCARPGEAEAQLSFAGLADLLEGAEARVLAGLPVPQRRALEVAVRRAEPAGAPPEPLAIAAGLLGVLRLAAGGARRAGEQPRREPSAVQPFGELLGVDLGVVAVAVVEQHVGQLGA
jgi:hypothetical protein